MILADPRIDRLLNAVAQAGFDAEGIERYEFANPMHTREVARGISEYLCREFSRFVAEYEPESANLRRPFRDYMEGCLVGDEDA